MTLSSGEDCSPNEPLTTRLKNLIRDYPEGVGIIKELIQNADDAEATCVDITFDWRNHNFDQLPDPRMATLMGSAMLVYNDSKFTDEDFKNITRLGDSSKKKDLGKTGRFGLGFNSIYNVTDYPSFISRDRIVFFDPHATAVLKLELGRTGSSWRFAKEGWWGDYPDFMRVYEPGGLEAGTEHFEGTLFRLPLRTAEQAKQSQIRNEPFTEENVRQLLAEFLKVGEEMLLFLKSVLAIRISEISPDGNRQDLLHITTQNDQTVKAERKKLLAPLQQGTDSLITRCQNSPNDLPAVSYQHTIQVTTPENQSISTWRVTSLIRAEDELLNLMQQLAAQGEKAVPWAGTAALISRTGTTQHKAFIGRAYCFLPLPQETGLPVHVNGFFDLDSSRHELTSDTLTGRDAKRVQWNQLLVSQVLSHAYANLIVSLVDDIGEKNPQRFYEFFPTQSKTKALEELSTYVIKLLQSKKVIRSAISHPSVIQQKGKRHVGKTHWVTPQTVRILPSDWEKLLEPLRLDGIDLPDPPLPSKVRTAFSNAKIPLTVFEPHDLRSRLLTKEPLGMLLANAPRECLRNQEWVKNLLLYCLKDGCRDVWGLPLAILADGTLQTFGYNPPGFIYIVPRDHEDILMKEIFKTCPHWFLDPNFAYYVKADSGWKGISMMTSIEVAKRLKDLINMEDDIANIAISWEPNGEDIPNTSWLIQVYNYLAEVKDLPCDELREVPLVPCNDGLLYGGGTAQTPLWHSSRVSSQISDAFQYFDVPLIEAQEPLRRAITKFRDHHPDTLVFQLTVPDLIDTLDAKQNLPEYHTDFYKGLISFLASDRDWLRGKGRSDDTRKVRLRSLPIHITNSGQPTALDIALEKVYIPGGYEPPKIAGSLKLLCLGATDGDQEWKELYEFLGVNVLDHATMIQNLLKDYTNLPANQQIEALEWIRDHLSLAQTELEQTNQSKELKQQVREALLIRCTDGQLRAASTIYHPKTYFSVRKVLGDSAYTPNMTTIYTNTEHWFDFFQELKMLETPSAKDLLAYIDGLIQQAQSGVTSEITEHLTDIFSHLEKHWEQLEKEKLSNGKTLAEALKTKTWLPVERNPEKLKRFPAFTVPQNRLYRSDEVCFRSQGHLVASQKPLFMVDKPAKTEFQQALGFRSPTREDVVNHLKALIRLWDENTTESLDSKTFQQSLNSIYKYFNTIFLSNRAKTEDHQWLRNQLKDYKCLWDGSGFWKPEHIFQVNVPFFGKWRQKIAPDSPIKAVYELLGQKPQPGVADYLTFLEQLAQECRGNPLDADDAKCIWEVLQRLEDDLKREQLSAKDYDLLLLTDDNLLLPPDQLFIPDAPWWLDAITDRNHIKILHPEIPQSLAINAGSRSLLSDVIEKPTKVELSDNQDANQFCQKWRKLLRSPEFSSGLKRLVVDQYGLDVEVDLSWLTRTKVKAAATITTSLCLGDHLIASGLQGSHYFEPSKSVFYLSHKGESLMRNYLTDSLNQQLGKLKLSDTARLQTMLESTPSEIEQLLDELRVKSLKRSNSITESFPERTEDEVDHIFDADSDEFELTSDNEDETTTTHTQPLPLTRSAPAITSDSSVSRQVDTKPSSIEPKPTSATANGSIPPSVPVSQFPKPAASPIIKPAKPQAPTPHVRNTSDQQATIQPREESSSESTNPQPPTAPSSHRRNNIIQLGRLPSQGQSRRSSKRRSQARTRSSNQQYRNGVRVRSGLEFDPDKSVVTEVSEAEGKKIDQAGMARVMDYERQHGREPQDMNAVNPNHPGYDIESRDGQSGEVRYIEVKSLRGFWDKRGVCISLRQFETGNEKQDDFWLYVVEQAETDEAKVTPIQNPVGLVGEFYYDDSWRQLADIQSDEAAQNE